LAEDDCLSHNCTKRPFHPARHMHKLPIRTNSTWLSDDELLLLDVLFQWSTWICLLRREGFREQWNLHPHNFNDEELRSHLDSLCTRGVLFYEDRNCPSGWRSRGHQDDRTCVGLTALGGELWSQERMPQWDRFCTERYTTISNGRTLMSVVAVSPKIRDDFLELWPLEVARRRSATIVNHELIPWRPFSKLYVGMATYLEQREWTEAEAMAHMASYREHHETLQRERSWWRNVPELQRFVTDQEHDAGRLSGPPGQANEHLLLRGDNRL
jgi:hypothetical protein